MRLAIWNSSGYVGSKLMKELQGLNYNVIGYDIAPKENSKKFIFWDYSDIIKNSDRFDAVVYYTDNFRGIGSVSTEKFKILNLSTICKNYGIKNFIYLSSYNIYKGSNKMINEMGELVDRTNIYEFEDIVKKNCDNYTIFRCGELMGDSPIFEQDNFLNSLICTAYKNTNIEIPRDAFITPYLHLDDLVNALDIVIKKEIGGIYNISSENISLIDVGQLFIKNLGSRVTYIDPIVTNNIKLNCAKFSYFEWKPQRGITYTIRELSKRFLS